MIDTGGDGFVCSHAIKQTMLLTSCAILAASAAMAAEESAGDKKDSFLEEVMVTATKTGETNLQSTPLAVSAFTAAALEQRQVSDVRDIMEYTPSLTISENTTMAQIFIRGVGSNNVFLGADSSSTIHLDGVYIARPESYFTALLDVERVEILRGPQGTLYGRNSVGGTINIISRRPSNELEGKIQLGYGNYDAFHASGYVNIPVIADKVLASFSGQRNYHDAYLKNIGTGNDIDEEDNYALRGQLLVKPSDKLELLLRADYNDSRAAEAGFVRLLRPTGHPTDSLSFKPSGKPNFKLVSTNLDHLIDRTQKGVSLEANYDIDDNLALKVLGAYRKWDFFMSVDADASSINIFRTMMENKQDQISIEANLSGNYEKVKFVLGAYYFNEDAISDWTVAVPIFGVNHIQRPNLIDDNYAFFGQGSYNITDKLSVTAGIRYTHEKKDFDIYDYWTAPDSLDKETAENGTILVGAPGLSDPFSFAVEQSKSAWTPKFGLEYQATDDLMLYASATRGFKSGGFDMLATRPEDFPYDPEYLWAYEAGLKGDFLEKRLRANIAAFYYDYTDLQVQIFVPPANTRTQNAADATIKGIELEMQARPTENLDIFASIAYLDATYKSFPNATITGFGTFDAKGKHLNNAPKWKFLIGGQYTHSIGNNGEVFIGGEYNWQGKRYYTPANDGANSIESIEFQKGYGLLNARLGWNSPDGAWQIMAYGKNLTDKKYVTNTGNFTANISARPGFPRTYGVMSTYKF